MEHRLCFLSMLAILSSSGAQYNPLSLVRMISTSSTSVSMETKTTVTPFVPTETPTDPNTDLTDVTDFNTDPPTTAMNTIEPPGPTDTNTDLTDVTRSTANPFLTPVTTMDSTTPTQPYSPTPGTTEASGSTVTSSEGVTEPSQSTFSTTTRPNESPTSIGPTTVNLTPESTNNTDFTNATQGTPSTTLSTTPIFSHTTPDFITISFTTNSTTQISTSTPTIGATASTLAPTPFVCDNGGTALENMICICPDEWTGPTCSLQNFCNATKVGEFQFPRTLVGFFAYSERTCPDGTSGAGKPQASARCVFTGQAPGFSHVQVLQCDQTLNDILQNLTSTADLEVLASSTQILTSKPEELKSENITAATQIANTLLQSPNATENTRAAAIATVSQLMSAPVNTEENNATQSLTQTLDSLSVNLSRSHNTSQVVQPNLVVQSTQILADDSQGVQFSSLAGTSGNFSANRLQLNTNTPNVVVDNGTTVEALVYLRFRSGHSTGPRQTLANVSMGFVLYQNNRFFTSKKYRWRQTTIRVLSATVRSEERSVTPEHVELQFRPAVPEGFLLHDFSCVFWDYNLLDWSTTGCSKREASDGVLRCFCNHTTNFAALWSYTQDFKYAEALDIISIVGLSFSILGLVVTILHHIRENFLRKSRKQGTNVNSRLALLCIYVSLLAFIITFIAGVQNQPLNTEPEGVNGNVILDSEEHVWPDAGPCTAVTALQHFFLLATFSWNSVYGTQLVLLVRSMRRNLPPFWTPLSIAMGWGLPAVVMAVTLAATYRADSPLGYRQEEFCWLAGLEKDHFSFRKPLFWGFLLPVGLILIYNMVLLLLTSFITCRGDPNLRSTRHSSFTSKVLVSLSLAVLLGLSWTLGYLVLIPNGTAKTTFSILFCICTTTQGVQIFIFFTARTPTFRNAVRHSVQYATSVRDNLNSTKYHLWKNLRESFTTETYKDVKEETTSL